MFRRTWFPDLQFLREAATTKKPTVEVVDVVPDRTSAEITFKYDYTGAEDASFTITNGSTTLVSSFTPKGGVKGEFTIPVTGLRENTSYTLRVTMNYNGSKSVYATSKSFRTTSTSMETALESLEVTDANLTYTAKIGSISSGKATATITCLLYTSRCV